MNQKNIVLQDYLEAILEHFHDGIYITDSEANTIYLNHSYEKISGLLKSEMLGRNMKDLVERGVISKSGSLAVLETGKSFTAEQSFRTGKRAIITSSPIYEDAETEHNLIMVVTIVREITEIYSIRKELRRKEQQNRKYLQEVEKIKTEMNGNIEVVAADKQTISLMRLVDKVSMTEYPVLLSGEPGVGKARIAEYIHKHSERMDCSFVKLNFSVIPQEDPLHYLLGYMDQRTGEYRLGILESADGGTIFMEELADLPKNLEGVFLGLIKEGACMMGDGVLHRLNIRIVAGSRFSLEELKAQGRLNGEILDSFSLFPFEITPLRERREDIVPLLTHFLNQCNKKAGTNKQFDRESYRTLLAYHWPGNVRELKNLVQRAAIISAGDTISPKDLFIEENIAYVSHQQESLPQLLDLKTEVAKLEAEYMERAFAKYGNTRDAAKNLGMDSSTFVRKRQKYEKLGYMKKS